MKYAFIEEQRTCHRVRRMCRVLSVSSSGYYEWRGRPPSPRAVSEAALQTRVLRLHAASHGRYGRLRIQADLRDEGVSVSKNRIGRLMRNAGIKGVAPRRLRSTTDSAHRLPVAENWLSRQFETTHIGGPDRVWAGDITYLRTQEGWLYLAVVLDLFSRKVIGWSMRETLHREIVLEALGNAVRDRRPTPGTLVHHDRGSQYASEDYVHVLGRNRMIASMSGTGDCWDNAVVESFFGTLKTELGDPVWETRAEARAEIFEYIEIWYNARRRHSTLGYLSPNQYESTLPTAA